MLHVLWRLDRVVKILEEEGEADPEKEADDEATRMIKTFIRLEGVRGDLCLIDHLDVTGHDARRDTGLLHSLEKAFIQLLVRIGLSLEDIVLDRLVLHLHRLCLLLFKGLPEKGFPAEA